MLQSALRSGGRAAAAAGAAMVASASGGESSARRPRPWTRNARGSPTRSLRAQCDDAVAYYGSYSGDRFGGGIGQRVGVDESRSRPLPGSGVTRVEVFSESHEQLRAWATAENWKEATRIHKAAYFTRTENPVQEEVLERIRQHYVSVPGYVAQAPVQMALFRCEDEDAFRSRCMSVTVTRIPAVVRGVFDERCEHCVVDFANKRLGGGWLSYGMVQEEKMFIERFDLGALCARSLVTMPIDPTVEPVASPFSMRHNEAWILRGAPAFAEIGWYGRTPSDGLDRFKLLDPGDDQETAPKVVAIDAIRASFKVYERRHLEMMLMKAYVGFIAAREDPSFGGSKVIATGSWGCGAFFNNERVMFVVQALAANLAGVDLTYHVLGDGYSLGPALTFAEDMLLKRCTVDQALDALASVCASDAAWFSKYKPRGKSVSQSRSESPPTAKL